MFKVIDQVSGEIISTEDYNSAIKIAGTLASNYFNKNVFAYWLDEYTIIIEKETGK